MSPTRKPSCELGLSRLYYAQNKPVVSVKVNEQAAPPVLANMKQTSLLWFVQRNWTSTCWTACTTTLRRSRRS